MLAIMKTLDLLSAQAPNGQYGCAVWVHRSDQRKLHNCQALLPLGRLPASGACRENKYSNKEISSSSKGIVGLKVVWR